MEGGVTDDHDLERVMPIIHGKFPGLPVSGVVRERPQSISDCPWGLPFTEY
jgi:hypothetical protein